MAAVSTARCRPSVLPLIVPTLAKHRPCVRNVNLPLRATREVNARDWTIGFVTPADIPALLQMIRALAEYEKLAHLVVADERALEAALFGERVTVEALIAREAGENRLAAGFALFFHTFSTFLGQRGLWLEDLFVYPRFRGNGLGRRLLVELAEVARRRGCGRFEWAVLDWNAPAIGFYERMGATLLREWHLVRVTGDALARFGEDPPP